MRAACGHTSDFGIWLKDRRNNRVIPHRFEACGYVRIRNPDANDNLWQIGGKRVAVYAKKELSIRDATEAIKNKYYKDKDDLPF